MFWWTYILVRAGSTSWLSKTQALENLKYKTTKMFLSCVFVSLNK